MSAKKMPKKLQKTLQEYLSKIKHPKTPSKNWILPGCKYPKTPSFVFRRTQFHENENSSNNNNIIIRDEAATLSDVDRFLLENFKSLYIKNDEDDDYPRRPNKLFKEVQLEIEQHGYDNDDDEDDGSCDGVVYDSSPKSTFELPSNLICSHRFFFAARSSSSLIEEARASLATTISTSEEEGRSSSSAISNNLNHDHMSIRSSNSTNDDALKNDNNNVELPQDCIAVIRYSNSPNDDFKRSMQEVVESRNKRGEKVDRDFLQELLYCYLDLNEKKSHKFIISAFVDLIVGLRQCSGEVPATKQRRISRERKKLRSIT